MARSYGQIMCSIWDDPDFCQLSAVAQRTYFMLVTQPDITACGSLSLTVRRWARTLPESDRGSLEPALRELEAERFVLVDYDTEELLVRTFAKHDGGYKHAKRVLAVIAYAKAVRSPRLRQVVASELAKLNVDSGIEVAIDCQSDATVVPIDSGRFLVTEVSTVHNQEPQPETGNREPAARGGDTAHAIVAEWMERVPKRPPANVIGQTAKHIRAMLAEGIDADDVRRGMAIWVSKGLHPSALPSAVNEAMNARPPAARRSTVDDRVQGAMDLSAELARRETTRGEIGDGRHAI